MPYTIWYCGVNYTCMIIMYKGYTHDSWGHFVNPSSQTHKLPPFVRGSLEWALSWPRFLNEKRVKEVLGVWKMTLYRVNRAGRFWCIKLELKWYIVQFPVFRWYLPLDRTDRVTCKHFILTSVFRELWIWQDLLSKLEPILVLLVLVAFLQIKTWSQRSLKRNLKSTTQGALEERDTKVTSPGCRYITKPVALHVSYQDSLKQSVLFGW